MGTMLMEVVVMAVQLQWKADLIVSANVKWFIRGVSAWCIAAPCCIRNWYAALLTLHATGLE